MQNRNFVQKIEDLVDGNGARFVVLNIRYKKQNLLKNMMIDGIEIVGAAALATYTWKSNCHPVFPLVFSAMGVVSVADFCLNLRKYILRSTSLQRDRLRTSCCLAFWGIGYFSAVHYFSEALKCNKTCIPYLGVAALCCRLAVASVARLSRMDSNKTGPKKSCELLFAPTLIACAKCYLLIFRQHDEKWLPCLLMGASLFVANLITYAGHRRVESADEPRWLLFKGLELFVGGCILSLNGAALYVYATNNQFHVTFKVFLVCMILSGIQDVLSSLECFQQYVQMESQVFLCIRGMILGPIIFLSACICPKYTRLSIPFMLPAFLLTAGIGLYYLAESIWNLHLLVPPPVFKRYCRRVLGPVVTIYGSLVAAYLGYKLGWRFSLTTMPLIPAGIYATYRGFRRSNSVQ